MRPAVEWDDVARNQPGALVLLREIILPLSLLAPAATYFGIQMFNVEWNAEYGYSMMRDRAPVIVVATYVFEVVSIYMLAGVFYLLARSEGRHPSFLDALRLSALGAIPLLLSGATLVIPFNVVFSMIATLYSLYLYYLGATRLIGIRESDATMFVGMAMLCMFILSGFLGAISAALGIT